MLVNYYNEPLIDRLKFPRRFFSSDLYRQVNRGSTDSIISWSKTGKSFIIWNQEKFCIDVLPKLKLIKWSTFAHRLKYFGFREVESGHLEFAHDDFVRGKPELTVEIEKKYQARFDPKLAMLKPPPPQAETSKALVMAAKEEDNASNSEDQTHLNV